MKTCDKCGKRTPHSFVGFFRNSKTEDRGMPVPLDLCKKHAEKFLKKLILLQNEFIGEHSSKPQKVTPVDKNRFAPYTLILHREEHLLDFLQYKDIVEDTDIDTDFCLMMVLPDELIERESLDKDHIKKVDQLKDIKIPIYDFRFSSLNWTKRVELFHDVLVKEYPEIDRAFLHVFLNKNNRKIGLLLQVPKNNGENDD